MTDLLLEVDDDQYCRKPVGVVESSLGGHYRHNLDHILSLLNAGEDGIVNYDHRERGTSVETNRHSALLTIRQAQRKLLDFTEEALNQPLLFRAMVTAQGPLVEIQTNIGRELSFVLSHTIHHNALIAVIAKLLGACVPSRFGYAPSTIAYQEQRSCVPSH
jgi:uncharacterized damage-inducible protein DinB